MAKHWGWVAAAAVGLLGCTSDLGPFPEEEDGSGGSAATGAAGGEGSGGRSTSSATGSGAGTATSATASSSSGTGGSTPSACGSVEWLDWPDQQGRSNSSWGSALTDIANHLPPEYGTYYDDPDLVTFGHETSHGIHAHLRNYENTTGQKANALYVLDDHAALVVEPGIWKSDVAPYVPPSLRGFRYDTYITGAPDWDDTPLYLFDEWTAYVNGAAVGVNRVEEGLWNEGWRDQSGNFEFVVYALAVGLAVKELDAGYFDQYEQFRAFLCWQTERSMALYQKHQAMDEFAADDVAQALSTFQSSADAEDLRQFVKTTFGEPWAQQVLGL